MQPLSKAAWLFLHRETNILGQVEPQTGRRWRWDQPALYAPREPGSGESPSLMLKKSAQVSSFLFQQKQKAFVPGEMKGFTELKPMFHKCILDKHKKEISSEIITNRCTLECFRPLLELKKISLLPRSIHK